MKSFRGASMFACAVLIPHCLAFQVSPPSSFVGRRRVYQHTRHLPTISVSSSMPPIIQQILKQQEKNVDETTTSSTNNSIAVVGDSPTTTSTEPTTQTHDSTVLESTSTTDATSTNAVVSTNTNNNDKDAEEEQLSDTKKMMQQVKDAGLAGIISYALWEIAFWAVSVPVCVFGYREVTGHWPDFHNAEDMQKLGAEAFAFVNFARFAVPLRIGLALSTTPWMEENVVEVYFKKHDENDAPKDDKDNDDSL